MTKRDARDAKDMSSTPIASWAPLLLLSLAFPLAIALQPKEGREIAAVFPPWVGSEEAVLRVWRADGEAAGGGAFANIVLARSDQPDFFDALHAEGALLIMDATLSGIFCATD